MIEIGDIIESIVLVEVRVVVVESIALVEVRAVVVESIALVEISVVVISIVHMVEASIVVKVSVVVKAMVPIVGNAFVATSLWETFAVKRVG